MNVRLYDGTVRCAEHCDASSFQGVTSDPCLYCQATPEPTSADEEWLDALSTPVIPSDTRAIILDKIQCDRCAEPATWKIVAGDVEADRMCSDHGAEWHPELFPIAKV